MSASNIKPFRFIGMGRSGEPKAVSRLDQELATESASLTPADLERCIDLISEYADSKLGLVHASIAALAERLGITRIFTLDRRHFSMLRPRHCDPFEIVP